MNKAEVIASVAGDLNSAEQSLDTAIAQATEARNAARYAASNKVALLGADKFSDDSSNPQEVVFDMKETIRARIGRRPNTLVMGGRPATGLKKHPMLRDHFKHKTTEAQFEGGEIVPIALTQAVQKVTGQSDVDQSIVDQAVKNRSGMPVRLN